MNEIIGIFTAIVEYMIYYVGEFFIIIIYNAAFSFKTVLKVF